MGYAFDPRFLRIRAKKDVITEGFLCGVSVKKVKEDLLLDRQKRKSRKCRKRTAESVGWF